MGKRETTMRKLIACIAIATLLAAAGCKKDAGTDAPAANASADSGGSLKGDFGPPQGKPVEAVLTSPPHVPPPPARAYPANVNVEHAPVEPEMALAADTTSTSWTIGGPVQGRFIIVRHGHTTHVNLPTHIPTQD